MSTATLTRPAAPIDRTSCSGNQRTGNHGTATDYKEGCKCPDAREARRLRRKRLAQGRAESTIVSILGPSRRLQALMAIGWSQQHLADLLGWSVSRVQELVTRRRAHIRIETAQRIAELYERLRLKPGPSQYARDHARYTGFLSALWWDNIDLDADPVRLGDDKPDHEVDEIAVELACRGELEPHRLRPVDQRAAMRHLVTTRLTVQEISERVHASQRTVERHKAQLRAERQVEQQRERLERFSAALVEHGRALRPDARDANAHLFAGLAHVVAVAQLQARPRPRIVEQPDLVLFDLDLPFQRTALDLEMGVAA